MGRNRISVVTSVYNGERHLHASVSSILGQSFRDFEFIIVNDGSTDDSREILAAFEASDSRIRVLDQSNSGLTSALRHGCAAAGGELIARQDADDWSAPTRLQSLVELLDARPNLVMASSATAYIDDEGEVIEKIARPTDPDQATHELLYEKCGPPAHGSVMFRRSAYDQVGGYRACFYYGQDSDLWLRLGRLGGITYSPEELYHARLSPCGISGAQGHWQSQFGDLGQQAHSARLRGESEEPFVAKAEKLRRELLSTNSKELTIRRQQAGAHYRIGTSLSRRGSARAAQHFRSAIRLYPLHWQSWCRLCGELFLPRK
jgi:glycosyltransferase involved in cell wall biosynthesis